MKHNIKITAIILAMFLVSQFIGLFVIDSYDNFFGKTAKEKLESGEITEEEIPEISVVQETTPPPVELKRTIDVVNILVSIGIAILLATLIIFILSKIRLNLVIRGWFLLVVFITLSLAFSLLLYRIIGFSPFNIAGRNISLAEIIGIPLAALFSYYKIIKRNLLVHNFTELFIYPGLVVIFLPLVNVLVAALLLILISVYDMIAVWKTKHMIALARYQIENVKIFTGFLMPSVSKKDKIKFQMLRSLARKKKKTRKDKEKLKKTKLKFEIAALGGGDVAFPLLFTATIFLAYGLGAALLMTLITTLALAGLLFFGKKNRPYPAMPFISIGSFLGLALVLLLF